MAETETQSTQVLINRNGGEKKADTRAGNE